MKIVSLIAILMLTPFITNAQDTDKKKYELGINLYNITDYGKSGMFWYEDRQQIFENRFVTGLMFKRNWSKSALRVSLDYMYRNQEADQFWRFGINGDGGNVRTTQSFFRIENRTGYQRQFLVSGKVKPYAAIDLVTGVDWYASTITPNQIAPVQEEWSAKSSSFRVGGSVAVGFKYQISKRFSANIETSLELVSNYGILPNIWESRSANFILNPIRLLSINYHF